MSEFYIGTSGWQYSHWRGDFYPIDLPSAKWLSFYSRYFNSVEVNSSFYRQTKATTFEKWLSQVPNYFVFSIKANRFITHIKRLRNCEEALKIFLVNLAPILKSKNRKRPHIILWQLPPTLRKDIKLLVDFLEQLSGNFRCAFEFRHNSWVDKETLKAILSRGKSSTSLVFQDWRDWPDFYDFEERVSELLENLPFIYLRFHGKKILYTSSYPKEELAKWGEKMQKWLSEGKDVYAYFNNDAYGYAVENALTLKEILKIA